MFCDNCIKNTIKTTYLSIPDKCLFIDGIAYRIKGYDDSNVYLDTTYKKEKSIGGKYPMEFVKFIIH